MVIFWIFFQKYIVTDLKIVFDNFAHNIKNKLKNANENFQKYVHKILPNK